MGACINGVCGKLATNEAGACEDGIGCTENDSCKAGVCVGGSPKFCPSTSSCSIGSCDLMTDACIQVPGNDGASCSDDDACTLPGTCSAGTCQPGGPVDCSFLDGTCSEGYCDSGLGCKVKPKNDGTPCDDNLYCTVQDTCNAGVCSGIPNTCAAPGDVCMIGSCNEAMKTCVAVPGNNGSACNDSNECTTGETCNNGVCQGGVPTNNGVACDDHDGCTIGTTCANGTCKNPQSMVMQCVGGDQCCPAGCQGADGDCLYWASGVQSNVPDASLVGWSQCWSGTYADNSPPWAQLLQTCDKSKLLLACRPVGSASWTLVAMAPRADVLFDCGQQDNCSKVSNGVGWYFSGNYSWGFVPGGQATHRFSCDYTDPGSPLPFPELRMCWHTGGNSINSGYRCGANDLNGAANWQRLVYHAD